MKFLRELFKSVFVFFGQTAIYFLVLWALFGFKYEITISPIRLSGMFAIAAVVILIRAVLLNKKKDGKDSRTSS